MISFLLLHFLPVVIVSLVITALVFRKQSQSKGVSIWPLMYFLLALLIFRPFIIAMWMFNWRIFGLFIAVLIGVAARKRKTFSARFDLLIRLFLFFFPIYLVISIMIFSVLTGHNCDQLRKDKHMKPVFSLCDKENVEYASNHLTDDVYHCRNAFFSSDRSMTYVGFGAETNPNMQTLVGVDLETRDIKREIRSNTVFRGYCHPGSKTCVFLVTPKNTIRIWDDEKNELIEDIIFKKDRPRFLSVDTIKPEIVYVATDGDFVAVINLGTRRMEKKIIFPTSALTVVDNTKKNIIATTAMPFRFGLMVADKKSEKVLTIPVGLLTTWKNFGYYFHTAADTGRERGFVVAPLECAMYVVDLEKNRSAGRIILPIGTRDITYDSKRDMVYAANFVNGYVYKIDVSGAKPKHAGRFFVGRRLRYFNYEADRDVFLAASSNGYYIYDPEPGRPLKKAPAPVTDSDHGAGAEDSPGEEPAAR